MEATTGSSSNDDDSMKTNTMAKMTTSVPSSEMAVSVCIQQGLQDILVRTSMGMVVGGLLGIVLARGGIGSGSNVARKVYTGLGGGIGLGTAWTNTSIQLEEMLSVKSSTSTSSSPSPSTSLTSKN